ncbi:hypothetical protein Q8F55_007498 [Vanrija albida]|uniref:Chromosome transmission fidelity protein 8 n=1 Tax=Vanrija albida TaxID=181172 RepID=A0ABR3PTP4_9TREE
MRIHLPLHPHHFAAAPAAQGPLARIGGELVVVELQGELAWEGDRAGGVVGVLGFDRPDHPTLHVGAHHLLHGKIATLPKPYAVIRRVVGHGAGAAIEGDAADEESDEEREARQRETPKKAKVDEEEDDEPPLFADAFTTPSKAHAPLPSSSPFVPSSAARDYSSDLSSPVTARDAWGFPVTPGDEDDDDDDEEEQRAERRRKRRRESKERTRHYEVVGVVRKKVVFALRPEPLVSATQLPE